MSASRPLHMSTEYAAIDREGERGLRNAFVVTSPVPGRTARASRRRGSDPRPSREAYGEARQRERDVILTGGTTSRRPDASLAAAAERPRPASNAALMRSGRRERHRARRHAFGGDDPESERSPDSPRTPPSGLPNGAGRSVIPALASQSGVLEMERDIYKRQRENERGDFEIAPVPPFYHLARDQRSEDSEERCVRNPVSGLSRSGKRRLP